MSGDWGWLAATFTALPVHLGCMVMEWAMHERNLELVHPVNSRAVGGAAGWARAAGCGVGLLVLLSGAIRP